MYEISTNLIPFHSRYILNMIVPFSEVLLHTVIDMWRQERFREDENRNSDWAVKKKVRKSRSKRPGYQRLLRFAQFGVPTIYVTVVTIIILIGLFNVFKMS